MNIKPFLTLASERLAGTPTHLSEGEAESIQSEEKPRASNPRRSREYPAQGIAKRVQPNLRSDLEKPKIGRFVKKLVLST